MPFLAMPNAYASEVEVLRQKEYPHMNDGVYLDHSGATIYAKSTVESFASKMMTNLYGNPHSENSPAKRSGDVVDQVREKTLEFLGADSEDFDLIFVANATAAIKLVADSFRDLAEKTRDRSFWYGYHKDAHTSIVGVREFTRGQAHCFESDLEVESWLGSPDAASVNRRNSSGLGLFAYPGQSNMTGRRLPLWWTGVPRQSEHLQNTYTLLDAAALAMTFPMENIFCDPLTAPDFTCLSLYKIFGFPDVGALVVRKASGHVLTLRKYFGGGTVSMVTALGDETWHRSKGLQAPTYKLHEGLEDGTLPFHSILALGEAIDVHRRLYGSMDRISGHTSYLVARLYQGMTALRHHNGRPLCRIYNETRAFGDSTKQGSAVAFNVMRADGHYIPYSDVERLANSAGIYIRSGGVCNPGGIATAFGYEPWMMGRALSAGHHCGSQGISIIHRLPTGIVRASLGAMSTKGDVDTFLQFLRETFIIAGSKVVVEHTNLAYAGQPALADAKLSSSRSSSTSSTAPTLYDTDFTAANPSLSSCDEFFLRRQRKDLLGYPVVDYNNKNNNNNIVVTSRSDVASDVAETDEAVANNNTPGQPTFQDVRELPRPSRSRLAYRHHHQQQLPKHSFAVGGRGETENDAAGTAKFVGGVPERRRTMRRVSSSPLRMNKLTYGTSATAIT